MIPARTDLVRQARYLQSIACLVKYAEKHDELQANAQALMDAANLAGLQERTPT
jgi:hypothetical protein